MAWQRHGLDEPEEVTRATEEYRADQDVIGAFLAECCVADEEASATARELYKAYEGWCMQNGEKAVRQRDFGTRLAERGFQSLRGGKGVRFWRGIRLGDVGDVR